MKKSGFDELLESQVINVIKDEYEVSGFNKEYENDDFENGIDMLECVRNEKDYEWMSDINYPEFASILLTDASLWANQYFPSRDFVNVYLGTGGDAAKNKALAVKNCINRTLNDKEVFHYQKYMRARLINALGGFVYLRPYWEQETKVGIIGVDEKEVELDVDEMGNQLVSPDQVPAKAKKQVPVEGEIIIKDRFNYDVLDPRNVYCDNSYVYSMQQKKWVIVRSEMTYEDLLAAKDTNGYFNLDKVKNLIKPQSTPETKTAQETYNVEGKARPNKTPLKSFDVLERYGSFWCKVKKRNEEGLPIEIEPGLDNEGNPLDDAELVSMIIATVMSDRENILIRFQPTPYIDSRGRPYIPLIRGLCYIHPTKDTGLSSAKFARELQIALNDTFNQSNDRVKFATTPVLKANKFSVEDNEDMFFAPEHIIPLNDVNDLQEIQISSDTDGALNQIQMIKDSMQTLESIYPTTMGNVPGQASTTATAVVGAENRSNARANYKSLTVEFTMLVPLYWMILQMTYTFAKPETALKLMGSSAYDFDPEPDYTYSPLSANIELEYTKQRKVQQIDQYIGRLANFPNPKTPMLINKLLSMAFENWGVEYEDFAQALLDESSPPPQQQGGNPPADMSQMVSNQNNIPVSPMEAETRDIANQGGLMGGGQ